MFTYEMEKSLLIFFCFFVFSFHPLCAQIDSNSVNAVTISKPRNSYVIGLIPSRVKNIYGIAIGPVGSEIFCNKPYSQSIDGLGIQLIGQGIFQVFNIGHHPFKSYYRSSSDTNSSVEFRSFITQMDTSEKRVLYNGLLVSPFGTFSDQVNGFSISAWMSLGKKVNGISANLLWNLIPILNGVSLGLVNDQLVLKGIQIGLWNKNEKRSLPLINWCFPTCVANPSNDRDKPASVLHRYSSF